jgi:cell division protein FtsZ
MALMGVGNANGDNRAIKAVEEAFSSPLLNDFDLTSAKNILVNITSSNNHGLTMAELSQIMDYISEFTGGNAENFKRGVVCDPEIGEAISVTIVATGFDMHALPQISSQEGEIIEHVILGNEIEIKNSYDQEDHELIPDLPVNKKNSPRYSSESHSTNNEPVVNKNKPALIVEPGEDISKFETQPAYIRKQLKLDQKESSKAKESDNPGSFRLGENNGKQQFLSDNSYIHQNQD